MFDEAVRELKQALELSPDALMPSSTSVWSRFAREELERLNASSERS